MRVVFLGTPSFALPSLQSLLDSDLEVKGVFTQPDRPAGRGLKLTPSPVKTLAVQCGLPVHQPPRIRGNEEARQALAALRPDVAVVVAFGQLLPQSFFSLPPLGTVNLHASLLPAYRGAAPAVHAIWRGEATTGVTIMKIDRGMDTGDILTQQAVPIGADTTAGELEAELARQGARLLVETLPGYASGSVEPVAQDHEAATYAPLLSPSDGRIDWLQSAADIHNKIRALNPRPGAFCRWRGQRLKLWRSTLVDNSAARDLSPGTVIVETDQLLVSGGGGSLLSLLELQLPGRARRTAGEFINGTGIGAGEVLE